MQARWVLLGMHKHSGPRLCSHGAGGVSSWSKHATPTTHTHSIPTLNDLGWLVDPKMDAQGQKEAGVFNECTLFWVTDTSQGDMLCTWEVCFGNFPQYIYVCLDVPTPINDLGNYKL